jgi:hypothetical protein
VQQAEDEEMEGTVEGEAKKADPVSYYGTDPIPVCL